MLFDDLLNYPPFSIPDEEKEPLLKKALKDAFTHHFKMCIPYQKYCTKQDFTPKIKDFSYKDLPFLPVNIFKEMNLSSLPKKNSFQLIRSSATLSQIPSTITLDQITKARQVKALSWLLTDLLGNNRNPFIIFDTQGSRFQKDENISARNAAIRGFLIAAKSYSFVMSENLQLHLKEFERALLQTKKEKIVLFGYTYIIYHYVAKVLKLKKKSFNLKNAKIIHIGGWKKLKDEAVDKSVFNKTLSEVFNIKEKNIIDVYGFTEQLGLIYFDYGIEPKRCNLLSEVIIRDPVSLKPVKDGVIGLIEFISPLPHSYPGIAILTDDLGKIVSRKRGQDGRFGTSFEVIGRAKDAELRGCGDVLAEIKSIGNPAQSSLPKSPQALLVK